MASLLAEAARHPEELADSGPTYYQTPLSKDEKTAGWQAHRASFPSTFYHG